MKDIDNFISRGAELTSHLGVCYYQPGNGTRYEMLYGHTPYLEDKDGPHQFFCTWLTGAGGRTVKHSIGGFCHWSYTKEKMKLNSHEDAKAISHFINSLNCKDYPSKFLKGINDLLPRGIREEQAQGEA